jgi:hypothetical protein
MKTKEEIEQLAEKYYPSYPDGIITDEIRALREGFIKGYRCQEDMADKRYTEEDLHTILRLRKEWYSHTDKNVVRDFIQSLNKS